MFLNQSASGKSLGINNSAQKDVGNLMIHLFIKEGLINS